VRIIALGGSLAALLGLFAGTLGGGTIGALAMVVSVTAEAVYTDLAARRLLRALPAAVPGDLLLHPLTRRALWDVFWPLAGTGLLNMLNRPLLSAGIAASAVAVVGAGADEAALAAWGLAWSLVMLVNGATLLFSQVAIAWDADPRPGMGPRGARVLLGMGVTLAGVLVALAFTPVAHWLLGQVYGAPPALIALAEPVLRLLVPLPLLMAAGAILRGRLIARGRARAGRTAQLVDIVVLAAGIGLALTWPDPAWRPGGAVLGALATLSVWTSDLLVLSWSLRATSNEC
jgi:Na+-driven multidrug efflux pump